MIPFLQVTSRFPPFFLFSICLTLFHPHHVSDTRPPVQVNIWYRRRAETSGDEVSKMSSSRQTGCISQPWTEHSRWARYKPGKDLRMSCLSSNSLTPPYSTTFETCLRVAGQTCLESLLKVFQICLWMLEALTTRAFHLSQGASSRKKLQAAEYACNLH